MRTQRLAAILFSDLAGYTRLMGEDQDNALRILERARKIHQTRIAECEGELLKELGDGFLAVFPSARQACNCAVKLIADTEEDSEMELHIGIHLGDVVFEKGDVFGEGVNIASRIEALAVSGEILVSESVYQNIRNERSMASRYHGSYDLKNVAEPVKVYEVSGSGLKFHAHRYRFRQRHIVRALAFMFIVLAGWVLADKFMLDRIRGDNEELVIAVMPFRNLSGNPEQDYFSEGLAYEIRSKLAEVENFKVRSSKSSTNLGEMQASLQEIGQQLNVTHVLDGSIQRFDNRFHFNLFLTNVENDESIPVEVDDYLDEDLYLAQVRIAMAVTDALNEKLNEKTRTRLERVPTRNMEAHRLYLQGIAEIYKGAHSSYSENAEKYLRHAIELDPEYAEAYYGLAINYWAKSLNGYVAPKEAFKEIRRLAEKTIKLNPGSASAYLAQGLIYMTEFKPQEAERELLKAIDKDPGNYDIYARLSFVYLYWDAPEKMQSTFRKAFSLKPLATGIVVNYYTSFFWAGKPDSAIYLLNKEIKVNPGNNFAKWMLGAGYIALDSLERALSMLGSRSYANNWAYGLTAALKGNEEEARRVIRYLENKTETVYVPPSQIGMIYWGLGDKERALEWMKKAHQVMDNFPLMTLPFRLVENEIWYQEWFELGTLDDPRNPFT